MSANFIELDSLDDLDALFAASHDKPVILFKHSISCGISADIHQQVGAVNGDVHIVVVQTNRAVSNAIEAKTGIRHASPQAFVIKDGKHIYHATHYGINPTEIEAKSRS
ncbi:MAG: bacillithiol system redox-active protein YtxJ [Saprospiraceae bacterium]|nr:bacillithiol system redox-active protein YtxJ [Pyrinomonadaceae bacterium]